MFFAGTGVVLEVLVGPIDDALLAAWRGRVERASEHLGWSRPQCVARTHRGGVSLAMPAPLDQLFLATEINEWALCASWVERHPGRLQEVEAALLAEAVKASEDPAIPVTDVPVIEESAAVARFERLASRESQPNLRALIDAATARSLPYAADDAVLTLGAGIGGRNFLLTSLPPVDEVPWSDLRDIPTALVTGSNGKTTTVRLIAACARMHGWHAGYNCTDGVFLDDEALATGDYSGPAGARLVLRDKRTEAAILETARGGILRRGIAASRARVAVVTNVSPDHFGEYGIYDLAGLADVKLSVAAAVDPQGLLVLNADDFQLRAQAERLVSRFGRSPPVGWFSAEPNSTALREHRSRGTSTSGVADGRIHVSHRGEEHDLGAIADMPLSMGGSASYNVANLAGAALAALALGITPQAITAVFATFGSTLKDNPGRLMRFQTGAVHILLDYAHNPDGLRGFLKVAAHLRGAEGRLGILLGQAGNRSDSDIQELVRVAAEFQPDLVVVKEDEAHLRGRAAAEVPRIIFAELQRLGFPDSALAMATNEVEAVRLALEWAKPGDLLALPVHSSAARATVIAMLQGG